MPFVVFTLSYSERSAMTGSLRAADMAGMKPANTIVTRRVTKRFYLCGDGESDVDITGRIFPSRVALCAAHQAHAVLEIIAENF